MCYICMALQQKCYHHNPWPWKHRVWHIIWHHISHSFRIMVKIEFFDNGCPKFALICVTYTWKYSRKVISRFIDPVNIGLDTWFDILSWIVSELWQKMTFSIMDALICIIRCYLNFLSWWKCYHQKPWPRKHRFRHLF